MSTAHRRVVARRSGRSSPVTSIACFLTVGALTLSVPAWADSRDSDADAGWHLKAIGVPAAAHRSGTGRAPVTIAIVDDGLDTSRPDLAPFLWRNPAETANNGIDDDGNGLVDDATGWDVADGDGDVSPPAERREDFYHGTAVAEIIVEVLEAVLGDAASDRVKLMPVKAVSDYSTGLAYEFAFDATAYALEHAPDIVLMPWAVRHITPEERLGLDAIGRSTTLGIASAGNELVETMLYPAVLESTLTVASIDHSGRPYAGSNHGHFVDLAAPGEGIVVDDPDGEHGRTVEGSSFAAALAAAAAALVKVAHADLSPQQVAACLVNRATPHDYALDSQIGKYGAGVLNVAAAMDCDIATSGVGSSVLTRPVAYLPLDPTRGERTWSVDVEGRYEGVRFTRGAGESVPHGAALTLGRAGEDEDEVVMLEQAVAFTTESLPRTMTLRHGPSTTGAGTVPAAGATTPGGRSELPPPALLKYRLLSSDRTREHCGGTVLVERDTVLTDGSGEDRYALHSDCRWQIVAPPGKVVQLEFRALDTEPGVDKLHFFHGRGTHEPLIGVLSGSRYPDVIHSWGNELLLWFVSDGIDEREGWKVEVSFVEKP